MDAEAAANAYAELVQEGGEFEVGSVRIGSRVVPAFLRAPPTLPQYFARGFVEHRDATFIVYENERLTFGEFERRAALLAHELMVVHDVRPGDRCAVSMRNMPEWAIAFCAASAIGAVVVPLNSWWQMKEMEYGLSDSGAKVLVCDAERHRRAAPSLRKLGIAAIVARATAAEAVDIRAAGDVLFDDALRRSFMAGCEQAAAGGGTIQLPSVEVGPDTAAVIMYTSGTTGLPKGVVQSHRGVCDQMHMVALGARLAERVARALGTTPPPHVPRQECIICPVPLFHVTGSHHIFLQCFVSGRKLCLMPKWDAGKALALIEAERATVWTGVPTMVQDMMAHRDFASRDTSSLKIIGGGGAPSPPSKVEGVDVAFRKQRGSGRASQGYGLTETNGAICTISGDDYLAHTGSCGRPFPIVEAKIVNVATGEDVLDSSAERGELWLRSSLVMLEYWNKPEKTAKDLTKEGWFKSGDVAKIDHDGFIYIVDRVKDIIIRGGENISCSEIEDVIYRNAEVMECAIFGLPDERLGEEVGLMVLFHEGHRDRPPSVQELLRGAKGALAGFKVPKPTNVYVTKKALPRGATGKIHKRAIKKAVAEGACTRLADCGSARL